ncbi:cyclase family protein [Streptomyces sioyaensis]|uniref:Cyclase family protein n=1 Tax=Streptomyces sioyaensis TaxID=67364 RepID=A0A4Q1R475_9ACTN|nr:cyclase family protein [Streptomyces sioyaensis]MBM4791826.1 cyclase family protein [Streptomyces sioyaensis]RXS68344.1 cyclase family protein [Streptomyces sioyaensis]
MLLDALRRGITLHDLAQPLETGMPCSSNHPGFRLALQRRHGDMVRPDGSSAANEVIVTGGHVGTHIDALCHASFAGKLFGGHDAAQAQQGGRFSVHGAETITPFLCRGVLLDVAAVHEVDTLPGGYPITATDLEQAAERSGVRPGPGEVALVRTGWARNWTDPEAYLGADSGVPGVIEEAAGWLADHAIRAAGADTTAFEHIPAGAGHRVLPVHRLLLVERGIHIIEHLNLEALAAAGVAEFLFVLSPLKIVGGTGSPVRPLAVVEGDAA